MLPSLLEESRDCATADLPGRVDPDRLGFDFVGADSTLELAMASTWPAGRVVQVGLAGGTAHVTALKTVKRKDRCQYHGGGNIRELREVLSLAESGRLTPVPLEFWPLAKINDV